MIQHTHSSVGSRAYVEQIVGTVAALPYRYRVLFENRILGVFSDEQAMAANLYAEAFNEGLQEGRRVV